MTKHTPGPWTITVYTDEPAYIRNAKNLDIATVYSPDSADVMANARLIAAAPELLAALAQAEAELALLGYDLENSTRLPIRAAIAKATGDA